jgi:hypothetical protein
MNKGAGIMDEGGYNDLLRSEDGVLNRGPRPSPPFQICM